MLPGDFRSADFQSAESFKVRGSLRGDFGQGHGLIFYIGAALFLADRQGLFVLFEIILIALHGFFEDIFAGQELIDFFG